MTILNKYDRILIIVLLALTLFSMYYIRVINPTSDEKVAVVTYDRKEVLRIDLNLVEGIKQYTVKGDQGDVIIEAKRGMVRVAEETSAYHLCSIQGWTESNIMPIVCLPNKVMIKIETSENSEVDSVIK